MRKRRVVSAPPQAASPEYDIYVTPSFVDSESLTLVPQRLRQHGLLCELQQAATATAGAVTVRLPASERAISIWAEQNSRIIRSTHDVPTCFEVLEVRSVLQLHCCTAYAAFLL